MFIRAGGRGGVVGSERMQIGEVADRTGLSLRTIRYYEEVGLVQPSARSHGGFRLYTEADIDRLMLIKRMKPLEFSLEEMRDLLGVLDTLEGAELRREADAVVERLRMYLEAVEQRCRALRHQLGEAEAFAASLRRDVARQRRKARSAGSGT